MEKLRKIKEEKKTEFDLKPSGRQIFEMRSTKGGIDDLRSLEVDEGDDEEFKDEEATANESEDEDEEEQATIYDKDLFAKEEGIAEDVDFD